MLNAYNRNETPTPSSTNNRPNQLIASQLNHAVLIDMLRRLLLVTCRAKPFTTPLVPHGYSPELLDSVAVYTATWRQHKIWVSNVQSSAHTDRSSSSIHTLASISANTGQIYLTIGPARRKTGRYALPRRVTGFPSSFSVLSTYPALAHIETVRYIQHPHSRYNLLRWVTQTFKTSFAQPFAVDDQPTSPSSPPALFRFGYNSRLPSYKDYEQSNICTGR